MPTTSFFAIALLLTFALRPLSCASIVTSRRSLHQPFFPLDSFPPSQPPSDSPPSPPSPSPPKYHFSSSSTPTDSPFFPTYPSPPPPPSPASFASFPANISSLSVPHSRSSTSSKKKLFPLIAAIASSIFVSAVALILFIRRRRQTRGFSLNKDTNNGGPSTAETTAVSARKQRTAASSNSSEFLYLGTILNSRGIDDSRSGGTGDAILPRKLDSPDLQPLPPLARRNHEPSSAAEETEEEFYSPRGSVGGRESSNSAGSGSRRVFACLGRNLEDSDRRRRRRDSSSSASSSFSSDSPRRSHSISLSLPLSLNPRKSLTKSPDHTADMAEPVPHYVALVIDESKTPLLLSSQSISPEKNLSRSSSDVYVRKPQSPSLSPLSCSPGRALERNPDVSLRMWNISDSNRQSLSSSLRSSSSPEKRSNFSNRIRESTLSLALGRSLERAVEAEEDQSDQFSLKVSESDSPTLSPSPSESPGVSRQPFPPPVTAPPPPPPPPPMAPIDQPISRPPTLIPLFRPFVLQNPQKISPIESELPPPSYESVEKIEETTPKPKLKPLHWDKVRATSDREMVWDQLRSSSFKLNEEMIETLFVVPSSKPKEATPLSVLPYPNQENRVLDPKKSQNIAILLRALNVTIDEVCEALLEGNADTLGTELLESLLKMAPTKDEERKLKDYKDDNSPFKLGPAEKFLKAMLDVPYAFKRIEAMLYIANFDSEVDYLMKSFGNLEAACEELRNSRMFLKLLEAVLKTGNRMNVGTNRGDALAFKLDTLLKLVDVKGADGRTTLLHFVVQEMIRSEGARLSGTNPSSIEDAKCRKLGLQVVSGLSSELNNVKKSAAMDSDVLSNDVSKLSRGIKTIEETTRSIKSTGSDNCSSKFSDSMNQFIEMAKEEILRIQAQENVTMSLVKEITEYFHGDSAKEEAHPFRIFLVVRDFLTVLDRVCKEVGSVNERTMIGSAQRFPLPVNPLLPVPVNPMLPQVLPPFNAKNRSSSSDEESLSP